MLSASAFGSADSTYLDLNYSGITKTSSNNCLIYDEDKVGEDRVLKVRENISLETCTEAVLKIWHLFSPELSFVGPVLTLTVGPFLIFQSKWSSIFSFLQLHRELWSKSQSPKRDKKHKQIFLEQKTKHHLYLPVFSVFVFFWPCFPISFQLRTVLSQEKIWRPIDGLSSYSATFFKNQRQFYRLTKFSSHVSISVDYIYGQISTFRVSFIRKNLPAFTSPFVNLRNRQLNLHRTVNVILNVSYVFDLALFFHSPMYF